MDEGQGNRYPFTWSLGILEYERYAAKQLGHLDILRDIDDAIDTLQQVANDRLDHEEYNHE